MHPNYFICYSYASVINYFLISFICHPKDGSPMDLYKPQDCCRVDPSSSSYRACLKRSNFAGIVIHAMISQEKHRRNFCLRSKQALNAEQHQRDNCDGDPVCCALAMPPNLSTLHEQLSTAGYILLSSIFKHEHVYMHLFSFIHAFVYYYIFVVWCLLNFV